MYAYLRLLSNSKRQSIQIGSNEQYSATDHINFLEDNIKEFVYAEKDFSVLVSRPGTTFVNADDADKFIKIMDVLITDIHFRYTIEFFN